MTTPPAIPPAAGRIATKSQAKGKLAGQMAPRERSNRFEHVLAHADAPKRSAKAEPLSEMQAPPVRKSERLMRDDSTTHAARRGPEREQRELHSLVAVLGGAEEQSEVADVSEGERDVGSPVPPVPVSSPGMPFAALSQADMIRSGSAESLLKQLADPDSTPQASIGAPLKPKSQPDSLHEVLARAGSSHRRERAEPMAVSPAPREMKQERLAPKEFGYGDAKPERLPTMDQAPLEETTEQPSVRDHVAPEVKPAPQPTKTAESRKAEAEPPPNMDLPPPETQVEQTHIRHDGPANVKLEQRSSSDHTPRQVLPERLPARDHESVSAPPEQRLPIGPTQPNPMAERLSTNPDVFASRVQAKAAAPESAKPETNSASIAPLAARQVRETGSIVSAPPELKNATAMLQGSPKVEALANVIPVAPLPAPRIALDKDVRSEPKPSTELTSDAGRTRSIADLAPGVAVKPGALALADGGKSERNERAGGGAADSRPSTPAQALAGTAAINLQAPLVEKLVAEAPAQQILRQLSEAEPVFASIPQAHDVHAAPRSMRLKLSPENLGEVEIRITREEGRLSIRIRAEQRETAEMLKNDSSFLLERLEFSAGPDRRIEIEFAGVADAGQQREATDRSGGSLEGGANRQAAEREAVPHDASAPRKSAGSSQDHADPDLDLQTLRGRPDVLLL